MILFITVTIPSDYNSILGTVNGEDTVFVADSIISNLCLCYCEEADSYDVVMNFYDSNNTILNTYTDAIIQDANIFIYDRSQADIDYIKRLTESERARLTSDLRGALNTSDLERLLVNYKALAILDNIDIPDYTLPEIPDNNFFASMLSNGSLVKNSGYQLTNSPDLPEQPMNDWRKWNALEQILFDNFDIKTTKFKYFAGLLELPVRSNNSADYVVIVYLNLAYKAALSTLLNVPIAELDNKSIIEAINELAAVADEREALSNGN